MAKQATQTQEPLLPADQDFEQVAEAPEDAFEAVEGEVAPKSDLPSVGDHIEQSAYPNIELETVMNNDEGEWIHIKVRGIDRDKVLDDFSVLTQNINAQFEISMARPTTAITGPHVSPPEPGEPKQPEQPRGNSKQYDDRG